MKKLLVLLALCMVFSVVLVACNDDQGNVEDSTPEVTTPEETTPEATTPEETTPEETTPEETTPEETTPEETTPEETTPEETTEPPVVIDPVLTGMSFDEAGALLGDAYTGFFTPGQANSWDKVANIEDYNVQYIKIWGWVGFFAETIGEFGYQIGDAEPVFSADFVHTTEQAVIDAAAAGGAKSASRFNIMVPVEYVSGEGIVIKAVAKDAAGTIEVIAEFTLTKPVNPNAPVAFVPAADMESSIGTANGFTSAVLSGDGKYITIDTIGHGDPYYQLPMVNNKGLVASHVAIKYRSTSTFATSEMFVGSGNGPSGAGDNIRFDLTCDGNWQLAIIDLAQASAVVDNVANYVRWDPFAGAADATIDLGYIALFNSAEAAALYDAQFAGIYRDVPNHEDVTIVLGNRNGGGPYQGGETKMGQKISLGENFLKQITITDMATYDDGNVNTWTLKVWQWAGDYATTVAGNPLYVTEGADHANCTSFIVDIPAKLLISGDIFYELEYTSGAKSFTGWAALADVLEGIETYVNGTLKEGTYASSIVVGKELPPVETIFYDGTNGDITLPAGGSIKFFVRGGAAGKTLYIANAGSLNVSATNFVGNPITLTATDGAISVAVTDDWDSFELTITNTSDAEAAFTVELQDAVTADGSLDNPYVLAGTEGNFSLNFETGWEIYYFTFTAEADGFLYINDAANMTVGLEETSGYTWLFDGPGSFAVTAGTTYIFSIGELNWAAGTVAATWNFSTEAPVEAYNVPQDQWAVTGHCPGIISSSGHGNSPMVAAGGIDSGALLHQGYVGVGDVDLSKYSKVVVSYGIDNSAVTIGHYDASANNRIAICKADAAMTNSPTDDNIIASTTYTLQGWKLVTVEIDLSAVDYNGPVFVTYDTLPGTFMLIGAIEFLP